MKTYISLFGLVCFSIAVVFLIGMIGCGAEETVEEPIAFTQAIPASGSTIQQDATIVVTFDGTPTGVNVTGGEFSIAGPNVTITGPFTAGTLNLMITWSDGETTLTYTIKTPEPDIPPSPPGMVLIPAGEFDMGSNDADAVIVEQPVHTVYVDAFYMDETEVTNTQFKEFLLENPQWQKGRVNAKFANNFYLNLWNGNDYPNGKGNHPVVSVSWYVAMAYAEWADKRLPTEAEWEYAARGGLKGKKYPNGNTITPRDANYGKIVGDTTPVVKYPENGYGLYDMAGNVWEWCLDEYVALFYATFPQDGVARNPLSSANSVEWLMDNFTDVEGLRVARGGAWGYAEGFMRVSNRNALTLPRTDAYFGFRCVRTVTP